MKETGIMMSGDHPKLILDGKKTQTRRVIKPQPNPEEFLEVGIYNPAKIDKNGDQYPGDEVFGAFTADGECAWECPYGQVGDRLWVRETWATEKRFDNKPPSFLGDASQVPLWFKYDEDVNIIEYVERGKWRPSIHMPRWASRITLEITEVRVERLQEITLNDIEEEGVLPTLTWGMDYDIDGDLSSTGEEKIMVAFKTLWDSLNAKRGYGWEVNPFVWVISFKVV